MNRQEHLVWCKKRANDLIDSGDAQQGFTSMMSDLRKHPDTAGHVAIDLGMQLMMIGAMSTLDEIRKFVNGFN